MTPILDILHPEPKHMLNHDQVLDALYEVFHTGKADHILGQGLVAAVDPGTHSWRPEGFIEGLHLETLVADVLAVEIDGDAMASNRDSLLHLLSYPPTEVATIRHRQRVLRELVEQPDLRSGMEHLYRGLSALMDMLQSSLRTVHGGGVASDMAFWRLTVLRHLKLVIAMMDANFEEAKSGLSLIREVGRALRHGQDYEYLETLLDYQQNLLTLSVKVRVGADGHVADFQIEDVRENKNNPLILKPLRRFFQKSMMWFRGAPFSNLTLVDRIIEDVFDRFKATMVSLFQLHAQLEFYLAGLSFRDSARRWNLSVCLPDISDGPGDYRKLFNPLLFRQKIQPVPTDLSIHSGHVGLITGPNSGGKTRLLQALGLTQVMGQSGLFVPATAARLPLMNNLFVSLVEETKVDQPEGRLGMELMRVRRLFEICPSRTLVILDELCSGTNPEEGMEIFELVLDLLPKLRPNAFISTHFLNLAARLAQDQRSGLAFYRTTLIEEKPTYQFERGVAATSLARQTAERLGVSREALLKVMNTGCGG